jgi:TPR repeat protein
MTKICPVCDSEVEESEANCSNRLCGWQFIQLLSDSPAERSAYESKLSLAKIKYAAEAKRQAKQQPSGKHKAKFEEEKPYESREQIPNLTRDSFETPEEFSERIKNQRWRAGMGTLKKDGYDSDKGNFPLELKWKSWIDCLSPPKEGVVFAPKDLARAIWSDGPSYPLHVALMANANGKVSITKIVLKSHVQDCNVEIKNAFSSNEAYDSFSDSLYSEESPDPEAQHLIGQSAYERGDYAEAYKWFQKAANLGFACAQHYLGWLYENGQGVEKNYSLALKWYLKAEKQNLDVSQYNLGHLYLSGLGVNKDIIEAISYFKKAANNGNINAQYQLGEMFAQGNGVEQNDAEAVKWFTKAAQQDNALGQLWLGFMCQEGRGTDQNYSVALYWYRRSANQGNANAQYNLGLLYRDGLGVEKNFRQAESWLRKSADNGFGDAVTALESLTDTSESEKKNNVETVKSFSKAKKVIRSILSFFSVLILSAIVFSLSPIKSEVSMILIVLFMAWFVIW